MSHSQADANNSSSSGQHSVRLHISPFNEALLSAYLNSQQLALASDISYHSIPTFPEKNFGFVTLPAMEADKVKKKLHGSTLKGTKVRVQVAKPSKSSKLSKPSKRKGDEEEQREEHKDKEGRRKKKKLQDGVLPGFELPSDRRVKRGWTDPNAQPFTRSREDKKEQEREKEMLQPSKYTKHQELLFKTKLPPTAELPEEPSSKTRRKSNRISSREVVVHEFENTQKFPSFLHSSRVDPTSKIVRQYVDGEGWLNEDGDCVEESKSLQSKPQRTSSATHDSQPGPTSTKEKRKQKKKKQGLQRDECSESETLERHITTSDAVSPGSHEHREDKTEPTTPKKAKPPALKLKRVQIDDRATESIVTDIDKTSGIVDDNPATPHPLESIYKRRKEDDHQDAADTFNFFDVNEVDENAQGSAFHNTPPVDTQTPTTRVGEHRWMRSGAPTPDTAFGLRRFSFSKGVVDVDDQVSESDEDVSENAEADHDIKGEGVAQDVEESPFVKWFWENRGDNNREWKRRRREALREKRKRENKRVSRTIL